jgi:YaiO family outer membrane protein
MTMTMNLIRWAAALALPAVLSLPVAAHAQESGSDSVYIVAQAQEFSDGLGSLRSVRLEYKAVLDDTTVLVSPIVGERRSPAGRERAIGLGATIYHDWSDKVSTRTAAFVAENEPVFANLDFAQDVTLGIADKTTVTIGGRWARYFGDREVTFLSAGARRYFRGGSVAYRLSHVNPEGRDTFFAHLVNLTLNDPSGAGKTQLWLSTGEASLDRSQMDDSFDGQNRAALLQRTQPLTEGFSLVASAGLSSYDRPGGDVSAINLGLGLIAGLR